MVIYRIVYYIIIGIGIITGLYRFLKLNKSSKVLWYLLIMTIFTELLALYAGKKWRNNWAIYEVYQLLKYILIVFVYSQELPHFRKWILYSTVVVFFVFVIETSYYQQKYAFICQTIEGVFIVLWMLIFFRELLRSNTENPFVSYPLFWISVGYLIFEVSVLFNFSAFNFILKYGKEYLPILKNIRIAANYALYSMYIVAFMTKQNSLK
ncbi:hypothetical protein [Runella zeae]|uniref:hypothetical protein n=1 Tax=Runella zeae TaxID=94255 RepID=UPI002355FA71|nr:hypothetical protein [Runella zeae]